MTAFVWLYLVFAACQTLSASQAKSPAVEFTSVPWASRRDVLGDPGRLNMIKGRVIGARPGQRIVLYARAVDVNGQLTWFVQPLANEPLTKIGPDSTWKNFTHPGAEYAALLVDPGFNPPERTQKLPTEGVAATAQTSGWPPVWTTWWFALLCVLGAAVLTYGLYRFWHYQISRNLNQRFEERLAERTRVAQELHDTLLQGVLSASMQLHVAVDQLPEDSPSRPILNRVLQLMAQVIDEGRNTLRGLRSSIESKQDLENSFLRVPQELGMEDDVDFRIVVEGVALPLRSVVRDDIYSIGREALVNAFRHSRANRIAIELDYAPSQLRIVVRDDGCGIDTHVIESGRDGHWGLSGMRERASRIGARLKVLSRAGAGTEVELRVPGEIAFQSDSSKPGSKWFGGLGRQVGQGKGPK